MAPRPGSEVRLWLRATLYELTLPVATTHISPVHSTHLQSLGSPSPALSDLDPSYPFQDSPGEAPEVIPLTVFALLPGAPLDISYMLSHFGLTILRNKN